MLEAVVFDYDCQLCCQHSFLITSSLFPFFLLIIRLDTTNSNLKADTKFSYICITEEEFRLKRKQKEYIEWGLFNRDYYGTSKLTVQQLVNEGKICCISLRPDVSFFVNKLNFFISQCTFNFPLLIFGFIIDQPLLLNQYLEYIVLIFLFIVSFSLLVICFTVESRKLY